MTEGESIIELKTQVNNIEKGIGEIKDTLKTFDDKFASKWVESFIKWGIMGVLGAVLVALLALVIKK